MPVADAGASDDLWQPSAQATFQLQLTGELDTSLDVSVYIVDLDEAQAAFATLHAAGRRTVCHFSAGSLESFREDTAALPESTAGTELEDFPNERWLDTRAVEVRELMLSRLARAQARGCSAVLPTNLDVHLHDSGFAISEAEAVAYARWLRDQAAERGLSAVLGTDALVATLGDDFALGLAFECLALNGCARWAPMRDVGKPVWAVEVGDADSAPALCARAGEEGLSAIVKSRDFDAFRIACP
jgi:hypothetical protein